MKKILSIALAIVLCTTNIFATTNSSISVLESNGGGGTQLNSNNLIEYPLTTNDSNKQGFATNYLEIATTSTELSYTQLSDMPYPPGGYDAHVAGDYAYVRGISSLMRYQFSTDTWTVLSDTLPSSYDAGTVVYNSYFYEIGGSGQPSTMNKYDLSNGKLVETIAMPIYVQDQPSVIVGDRIYNYGCNNTNLMWYYDISDKAWTSVPNSGQHTIDPSANVVGTDIYYIGGTYNGDSQLAVKVQKFDTKTNTFTLLATADKYIRDHVAVYDDGYIYNIHTYYTEVYDVVNNTWSQGTLLGISSFRSAAALYKSQMYVFGQAGSGTTKCYKITLPLPSRNLTVSTNLNGTSYSAYSVASRGDVNTYTGTITGTSSTLNVPIGSMNVTLSKTGYSTVSTGTFTFNSNTSKSLTLTPNKYAIVYNANGGSVSTTSENMTATFNAKYPTQPIPTRAGYTFLGWYTSASGGTKITTSDTYTTANDSTLYAQWKINNYNIAGTVVNQWGTPITNTSVTYQGVSATTNSSGQFSINTSYSSNDLDLTISKTGYTPVTIKSKLLGDTNLGTIVQSKKYFTVSGTALDKDGKEIPNAKLIINGVETTTDSNGEYQLDIYQ